MPDTDTSHESTSDQQTEAPRSFVSWRSITIVLILLFLLLLLAILPPLLNVSRFKRRIVTSISTSIGRPVHLDNVSLVLLPFPAFKIENFVVEEDPAFGAEPIIRANNVEASLRFNSLWRRKVEFSKISLTEPSINLVHNAQGAWNVESILLQAARIPVAPTAQTSAGPNPRFPYIEATGARVNIKSGLEKLPFSLTEAEFALWLPGPQQWRIRVVGKPTRTDTSASDTGTVSLDGTLGGAERLDLIPIDLSGEWKNAPLGEASRILLGRDAGIRGDLRLNVSLHGTLGENTVKTTIEMDNARRADFVPDHPLDLQFECQATAAATFHAFRTIHCTLPPPGGPARIALTGDIPDIHQPAAAAFEIGTPALPASVLLNWLQVASPRVPPDLIASGNLTGKVLSSGNSDLWSGELSLKGGSLSGGPIGDTPIAFGDTTIASDAPASLPAHPTKKMRKNATIQPPDTGFILSRTTLSLGAKDPAILEGRFDRNGYSLHLSGTAILSHLLALAAAIPQFGDGLSAALPAVSSPSTPIAANPDPGKTLPIHIDLTSTRLWNGSQSWSKTAPQTQPRPSSRHRR